MLHRPGSGAKDLNSLYPRVFQKLEVQGPEDQALGENLWEDLVRFFNTLV